MNEKSLSAAFLRLVGIMDDLREKCPWDRKQTIQTLRSMTIEETYELGDAIAREDWKEIKEELGDLLLHILFYSRIGREQSRFDLEEVINNISEKLIYRHPHIYPPDKPAEGLVSVENEDDVKKNWEKLKLKEGKKSVLSGVPFALPATVKAIRLQEKSAQVGFEWKKTEDVWQKVEEEVRELREAVEMKSQDKIEEEYGDLIFSLINYARFLQIDAETALEKTNQKFTRRFSGLEQEAATRGKSLSEMSLEEMDAIWNAIKKQ